MEVRESPDRGGSFWVVLVLVSALAAMGLRLTAAFVGWGRPGPRTSADGPSDVSPEAGPGAGRLAGARGAREASNPAQLEPSVHVAEPENDRTAWVDAALATRSAEKWEALFDVFERNEALPLFRLLYSPIAVRPLGLRYREWRDAMSGGLPAVGEFETSRMLTSRLSRASAGRRREKTLSKGRFQLLAFQVEGEWELITGLSTGGLGLSSRHLAEWLVSAEGGSFRDLSPAEQEEYVAIAREWVFGCRRTDRRLWDLLSTGDGASEESKSPVVGVDGLCILGFHAYLVRSGEDAHYAGLLARLAALNVEIREAMRDLFS